jgi:hypothetical protein
MADADSAAVRAPADRAAPDLPLRIDGFSQLPARNPRS